MKYVGGIPTAKDREYQKLAVENARLRAELEAERLEHASTMLDLCKLRPKPVVERLFCEMRLSDAGSYRSLRIKCPTHRSETDNLKLTFADGVLTHAEVINDK